MFLFRSFSALAKKTFDELLVPGGILEKLNLKGITSPSALQESLIPTIHSHSDIFLKDETGSGKTLGIVLGILSKKFISPLKPLLKLSVEDQEFAQRRLKNAKFIQTLIVVPTRDLASQIYHWILELEHDKDIDQLAQLAISSRDINRKTAELPIPRILIGTPPKLLEMIEKKTIDLSRLQTLVMDEADRLILPLSRYADIKKKFNRHAHRPPGEELISQVVRLRRKREQFTKNPVLIEDQAKQRRLQVIISSATANNPLKMLLKTKKWISDPVYLNIGGKIPSKIKHIAYQLDSNEVLSQVSIDDQAPVEEGSSISSFKPITIDVMAESISSICSRQNIKKAMVFVHSEYSVTDLVSNLDALGLKAARLSDMNNFDGEKLQAPFADWFNGSVDIVVGTEYEARGLDIPNLEHVIIVGTVTPASYTHMSGRTGRFGKSGTAITLLTDSKQKFRFSHTLKLLDIKLS